MREKCTRVSAILVGGRGRAGGRATAANQEAARFMSTGGTMRERKEKRKRAYYDFLGRDFVHSEQSGARQQQKIRAKVKRKFIL